MESQYLFCYFFLPNVRFVRQILELAYSVYYTLVYIYMQYNTCWPQVHVGRIVK